MGLRKAIVAISSRVPKERTLLQAELNVEGYLIQTTELHFEDHTLRGFHYAPSTIPPEPFVE